MANNLFSCTIDSTSILITILQSIQLEKDQKGILIVSDQGMIITASKSKTLQARGYIKRSIFGEYAFLQADERLEIILNLSVMLQCLTVFGESALMKLFINHNKTLNIILEENSIITQVSLLPLFDSTLEDSNSFDSAFRNSAITHRLSLKSSFLKESFTELDIPGAEIITLILSPQVPYLIISTSGVNTSCELIFPDNHEIFSEIQCSHPFQGCYSLALIKNSIKALNKSNQFNIRINAVGMLSMQHRFDIGEQVVWLEFILSKRCKEDED